jgi:hypothetical protein
VITIDLMGIDRDAVLGALRELDREAGARLKAYPKMVVDGKLTLDAVTQRQIALATAREVVACVARGMISECGRAVRVLPVGAAERSDGGTDDGEAGGEA